MAVLDTRDTVFAPANVFGRAFHKLHSAISAWNAARVTRNALSQLSDRELEDIGLNRSEIIRVARRG
ncbi:DUF1127 domain-containing protein [Roseovarius sp. SYSU LYC5161]|uniref:DUF1127 domain-containing protein n=1 Tax=Roseovarius halophilus (ex Wu et al. 2025) TaxID=3376060 RepID=UPI003999EC72